MLAVLFFGSVDIYAFMLAAVMNRNKSHFPEEDQQAIAKVNKLKWIILALILVLAASAALDHKSIICPVSEWLTALLSINFFMIISVTNEFYDSVVPIKTSKQL